MFPVFFLFLVAIGICFANHFHNLCSAYPTQLPHHTLLCFRSIIFPQLIPFEHVHLKLFFDGNCQGLCVATQSLCTCLFFCPACFPNWVRTYCDPSWCLTALCCHIAVLSLEMLSLHSLFRFLHVVELSWSWTCIASWMRCSSCISPAYPFCSARLIHICPPRSPCPSFVFLLSPVTCSILLSAWWIYFNSSACGCVVVRRSKGLSSVQALQYSQVVLWELWAVKCLH